jgi:hypothetical protein
MVFYTGAGRMVTVPVFFLFGAVGMVTVSVFFPVGAVAKGDMNGVLSARLASREAFKYFCKKGAKNYF